MSTRKKTIEQEATPEAVRYKLLRGQKRLTSDKTHTYLLALGGVGSGKTSLGYPWHHTRCVINRDSDYSLIVGETGKYTKLLFKGYISFLESIGYKERIHFKCNRQAPQSIKYFWGHEVLFWSAETKIVSINTSHDWQDEPALFQQETTWEIDQRRRCPKANLRQSLSTTSPEGMNHLYEFFGGPDMTREGRYSFNDRKLVLHSSSYDNPFLPPDFFISLEERFGWDDLYFRNYVMGEWVNLTRNAFYFSFTEDNIRKCSLNTQTPSMVWTLDNNVGKMQWAAIQRQGHDYAVFKANAGTARNLQEVANELIKDFPPSQFKNWQIDVAGDAVLHHRSPQTYTSGYELLETLLRPHYPHLRVTASRQNPLVIDRSMTTNKLLKTGRLVIDPGCKRVLHSVRSTQSDGKNGIVKPSKDEVTHAMEAVDHALCVLEPLKARSSDRGATW